MAIVSQKTDARNEYAWAWFTRAANKGLVRDGTGRVLCPIGWIPEAFTTDVNDVQGQFPVVFNTDRMPFTATHNLQYYYDNASAGGTIVSTPTAISLGKGVVSEEGGYILLEIFPFRWWNNWTTYSNNVSWLPVLSTATTETMAIDTATGQIGIVDTWLKWVDVSNGASYIIVPTGAANWFQTSSLLSTSITLTKPTNVYFDLRQNLIFNLQSSYLVLYAFVKVNWVNIFPWGKDFIVPVRNISSNEENDYDISWFMTLWAGSHNISFHIEKQVGTVDNNVIMWGCKAVIFYS